MIRKLLLMFFALVAVNGLFAQSGTVKGKVLDADNGDPIPFANVSILDGGKIVTGGMTDFDGVYTIKPVPVGKFTLKVSFLGYKTIALNNVQVNNSKITFQDFKLPSSLSKLEEVVVKEYKVPLISKDQVSSGGTISQEDIGKMPGRSATSIASTVGGVSNDGSGNLNIRGARSDATVYYVDGVKVMGNTLPKSAIEQINVITGGLEARYGDATGGIVSITTRGASKSFAGGAEFVTSHLLDGYSYNLANVTLMGPLYSKKEVDPYDDKKIKKTPILGFLLTADATYMKDQSPDIKGAWVAKDGVVDNIKQQPYHLEVVPGNAIVTNLADYYGSDKFENQTAKPNNSRRGININGKVTYNITPNMFLSVGGRLNYNEGKVYSLGNSLFNSDKNGQYRSDNWQVNARFTHKLKNKTEEEEKKSASVLKNVYYQLVASYEKYNSYRYDDEFNEKLFNYGHVGQFNTKIEKTYAYNTSLPDYPHGIYEMNGFAERGVSFTPSQHNPDLANYTNYYFSLFDEGSRYYLNKDLIQQYGGLYNGSTPPSVYGYFSLPGTPYNGYSKSNSVQTVVNGEAKADIKNHELSVGFQFEQRDQSYYGASPTSLWQRARQLSNSHISELDKSNPIRHYTTDVNGNKIYSDTISYNRLYSGDAQTMFDYKFREYLNGKGAMVDGELVTTNGLQYIQVDSYNPEDLSIDYFSADELLNEGNGLVSYYGYDPYGNKMTDNVTLEDFFTETNELGKLTRPVASFRPNYLAFYVQDKFSFDDLVFRVGVRADRYDANQQTLKDPYSLHNVYTVGELKEKGVLSNVPSNVGDDYYVYGNDLNYEKNATVNGYRIGDNPSNIKWFNADGTQVESPKAIESPNGITPFLKSPDAKLSEDAFTDYTPQWNFMPRISFSFPVSDVSLFSAHYDVMTKRPMEVNRLNPIHYLHLQSFAGNPINNPNLAPETTIEYELGFQQKVSNTSSLKIAAFYREMRDLAQVQNMTGAYPTDYITYQNIDFGTIKGLTVTYDLRRTGNLKMGLNYTLQFANGTGSSASTALNLIQQNEPNLRTIFPLNYDTRHAINATIDYSYASGKKYDGPVLFGKKILENTGVSFVLSYKTGNPYSRKDLVDNVLLGTVNGSRMPSTFMTNMRIYRDIPMKFGKKKATQFLQVYLDVANLFNTMNVRSVFNKTGNADDDAYLSNPKNLLDINSQVSPEAYANYYRMRISMFGMYYGPRTIHLGLTYTF